MMEMEEVNSWAESRQLSSPFHGSVVVSHENHVFSIGTILRYGVGITAVLLNKEVNKKTIKGLKKELRSHGKLFYRKEEGYLHFLYQRKKRNPHVDIDNGLAVLSTALNSYGIRTRETCVYCGLKDANYGLEIEPGVVVPAHYQCRVEGRERDFFFMQRHQQPNNYMRGVLGGLLGGFLGALPSFLLRVLTSYDFSLLYLIIPMATALGFQKMKGKSGRFQKIVISAITVVVMVFTFVNVTYLSPYVYQYQLFQQAQMVVSQQEEVSQIVEGYPEIGEAVGVYQTLFPQGENGLTIPYFIKQIPLKKLHGESYFGYLKSSLTKDYITDYSSSFISVLAVTFVGILITLRQIGNIKREEKLALHAIRQLEKPVSFLMQGKHVGEVDETKVVSPEYTRDQLSGAHLFGNNPDLEDTEPDKPKSYNEIFGELFDEEEEE